MRREIVETLVTRHIPEKAYAEQWENEYKREAFALFQQMLLRVRENLTAVLARVEVRAEEPPADLFARPAQPMQEGRGEVLEGGGDAQPTLAARPVQASAQVDPNDPNTWRATPRNSLCPCGSGKKYKYCHGK
jgi:preprotein translocase subunit SecA